MPSDFADLLSAYERVPDPDLAASLIGRVRAALLERDGTRIPDPELRRLLSVASAADFRRSLTHEQRYQDYEPAIRAALLHLRYSIGDMLADRARLFPDRTYLEEGDSERRSLTFAQTALRCGIIAHALRAGMTNGDAPRVALFTANTLEGALCDLACLVHRIFITPLSVHLDEDALASIFRRLGITTVLVDTDDRLRHILHVITAYDLPVTPLFIGPGDPEEKGVERFDAFVARNRERPLSVDGDNARMPKGNARDAAEYVHAATVMFTSGSTGQPKGVCFSQLNMISKRFARAAALPEVGDDETLVAFLPLFHTFGRFLELQGMLFWGGRYVFAGNPGREALFARMRDFHPTGLISIPQRWAELRDEAERSGSLAEAGGGRLRWGLSAAGYLRPETFRFFHREGVALCSGFGMTEATGGILMTPPDAYEDDSVGIPLPGIEVRLSNEGEMLMRGPYVAAALPEKADGVVQESMEEWVATGDLFTRSESGHYRIVDRVKDIYKNSRGQTIAPLAVENRFRDVPGIRRCFLAGDGRSHNTLLIVLDDEAPVLQGMSSPRQRESYFNEIVRAVNAELPVYERIVEFTLLDSDFSQEEGELTPKGSLNRKRIAERYRAHIDRMYSARSLTFRVAGLRLQIPLWMLRDIGCTERDMGVRPEGLYNAATQTLLRVAAGRSEQSWRIGDLEYQFSGASVDLGRLCRQPAGWTGNAALEHFLPCHEGWDVTLDEMLGVYPLQSIEPSMTSAASDPADAQKSETGSDTRAAIHGSIGTALLQLHRLLSVIYTAETPTALQLFDDIGAALQSVPRRHAALLRARLGACAWHPEEAVRIRAYETLLLFDPNPTDPAPYEAFMHSGRSFIDGPALDRIASPDMRGERLSALRRRLQSYRAQRPVVTPEEQRVYGHLLALLYRLASYDPACVYDVRAEFALWMQVRAMRKRAEESFYALKDVYVRRQRERAPAPEVMRTLMDDALNCAEEVREKDRRRIRSLFSETSFLPLTVLMLFDIDRLEAGDFTAGSLRVEALPRGDDGAASFRIVLRTQEGRRFAFRLLLDERYKDVEMREQILTLLRISGAPVRLSALPRFGSYMPEAGAIALAEAPGRTLAEMMEQAQDVDPEEVRRWWVSALAAWIRGWRDSGRRLLPGAIEAENVIVPRLRYREGAVIASVAGWRSCEGPHCLVEGLLLVLRQADARTADITLHTSWVVDAFFDVLPEDEAHMLLESVAEVLDVRGGLTDLRNVALIRGELQLRARRYRAPLAVQNAVACWRDWANVYPLLVEERGEEYLRHVFGLYGVARHGEAARWYVTRHTLLADLPPDCAQRIDELIFRMHTDASFSVTRSVELAELQERLPEGVMRERFLRMVFPADTARELQIIRRHVGGKEAVVVEHAVQTGPRQEMRIREPLTAAETGGILSLLLRDRLPVPRGEELRYLALIDDRQRVAGGLVYTAPDAAEAELQGIIVEESLRGCGFGRALLDDLAVRLQAAGAQSLRAPHYLSLFCTRAGFTPDPRDGELRRGWDIESDAGKGIGVTP